MRPLWFQYPDDPRTYLIEDQYLLGATCSSRRS